MDFTTICRCCIIKIPVKGAGKMHNYPEIVEMFCYCLKISDEANLPQQFCTACVNKITSAYTFLKSAHRVDMNLRNMLSRVETSVIIAPRHDKNGEGNTIVQDNKAPIVKEEENNKESRTAEEFISKSDSVLQTTCTPSKDEKQEVKYKFEYLPDQYEEDGNVIEDNKSEDEQNSCKEDVNEKISKKMAKKTNVCKICSKRFASKKWFSKHMKKEHSQKKFTCKYCIKTFITHRKWQEHLIVHSEERNFNCRTCGNGFKRKKNLAAHTCNHNGSRPFVCDICKKSFRQKYTLASHMQHHQGTKNVLCSVCGIAFYAQSNLRTHMRVHTGERPFACGACAKAFSTSSSLRRHERLHRGDLPHACDLCGKRFSCLGSLIRHRYTHTGEQPYHCPRCPRTFPDSWKRKVHLMREHGAGLRDIPRLDRAGAVLLGRGRPVEILPLHS